MAELATISRPYANALFDLAVAAGQLDDWSKSLAQLDAVSQDPAVQSMLESPDLAATDKASQLAQICADDSGIQIDSFLGALAEHDRLSLLGDVRDQFEVLRADQERSLDVEVVSAFDMTEAQVAMLQSALQKKFDKDISITPRTESGLVGGVVIRAGDVVIDGSVNPQQNS